MGEMKASVRAIAVCSVFAMCLMSEGQSFVGANNAASGSPYMRSELGRRMAREQMRARNRQRQERLQSDTEKLLNEVNDLQQQMRSDVEFSPADLSRRAAEIEKLARSVQNRMKGDS
jgi:NAD(P)-dependent dehydrogenase (short-subunit alcohol dehydrogenase family)